MLARDSLVQAGLPDNPYARQLRNGFRWLRFEKELENEFREFLSWNSLMQRRAAIGVAFLIWALFIVADWMMVDIRLHPSLFEQLLGVRLGMIGLLLVVWPAAFLPSLRKVGDAIAPYCLLLINLAVLACDVLFEWHGVPRFAVGRDPGYPRGVLPARPGVLGLRAPGVAVPGPEPGGIPALRR